MTNFWANWHLPHYISGKKMSLSRPVLKCLKPFCFSNDSIAILFAKHSAYQLFYCPQSIHVLPEAHTMQLR